MEEHYDRDPQFVEEDLSAAHSSSGYDDYVMRGSGSGSAAAAASSSSADIADESGFVFEVAGKLKFQVTEPQRHGGEGKFDTPFWTYKIVCNTSLPAYRSSSLAVDRRYKDFEWLHDQMVAEFPGVIVPPIPEKTVMGSVEKIVGGNAQPLVAYRQRALEKFLARVSTHPRLHRSNSLKTFMEYNDADFSSIRNAKESKKKTASSSAESFAQRFKEMSFSLKDKVKKDKTSGEVPDWLDQARDYITLFDATLAQLREKLEVLVRRRREMSVATKEFGAAFSEVAEIESCYEEGPLSKSLSSMGSTAERLSDVLQEQADRETLRIVEVLVFYSGVTASVQDVIKHIESLRLTQKTNLDQLTSRREQRRSLVGAAGKEDKVRKLDSEITEWEKKEEESRNAVAEVEKVFTEELRRMSWQKQSDFKEMMSAFISLQVDYNERLRSSWDSIAPTISQIHTYDRQNKY